MYVEKILQQKGLGHQVLTMDLGHVFPNAFVCMCVCASYGR